MHRCNATVDFLENEKPFYPPAINHESLHESFQKIAGEMLGAHKVKDLKPTMGTEDFAFYQEKIPGYYFYLGMANETVAKLDSTHSPNFQVNEDILPYGAAFHASLAATYLY